jgi:hypothetical protein
MTGTTRRGFVLLATGIAAAALDIGAGRAQAQWGMGGMGFGFFGGNLVPNIQQPGNFVNEVALAQMNHVRGPIQNNVYAGNPNSYINHIRDNGFVDQYSPYRREPSYYAHAVSSAARQRPTPTAMTVAQARPIVPLASFFNAANQLVWPADAPMADGLQEKREASDRTCRAVLDEVKNKSVASIATVSEARQKLLDYGRPALRYVRAHETPRVADSFHGFLLELYDALAQAADPSTATAGAPRPS